MLAQVLTVAFQGIRVLPVIVQVQVSVGLPSFTIVGLADKAVTESRERVRASFLSIGLDLPPKKIIVNLAPADLQKEGAHYDLPIALGLMVGIGVLSADELDGYLVLGELGLDASINKVAGVLPAALEASSLGKGIICPEKCKKEAVWAGNIPILAAPTLLSLLNHFKGVQVLSQPLPEIYNSSEISVLDYKDVKGQSIPKRVMEIAAAGHHHVLMIGPPGAGKSMLAARLPGISLPMTPQEILETSVIHSLSGKLEETALIQSRPFRDPHHSASLPALIGGGMKGKPGEVSLAHNGLLFLDELPEFSRSALESLRQPLEAGRAVIARANVHITYPAKFQLIGAMNPCRCGYFGDVEKQCHRVPKCAQDYQSKLSGPLMDRFDMVVDVGEVNAEELFDKKEGESSSLIVQRITQARLFRFHANTCAHIKDPSVMNASLSPDLILEICKMDEKAEKLLRKAVEKFKLSGRSYHRILRVSRTIADLAQSELVLPLHIAESLSYRKIPSSF